MSIADCLNNSKVGDYLVIDGGRLDKYLIAEKKPQFPTGSYPVIINMHGEKIGVPPNTYRVIKIIKCQKPPAF